jgi:uncharacterized membrane protein YkvI
MSGIILFTVLFTLFCFVIDSIVEKPEEGEDEYHDTARF